MQGERDAKEKHGHDWRYRRPCQRTWAKGSMAKRATAVFPTAVGLAVAGVAAWFGAVTGIRAFAQARRARAEEREGRRLREIQDGDGREGE